MKDRELLKAAAKAAGMRIHGPLENFVLSVSDEYRGGFLVANYRGGDMPWNPLRNDGDALALAMELQIDLQLFAANAVDPWVRAVIYRESRFFPQQVVDGDALAAIRRAIVSAAAALGEG